jgi:hypothetical protein
MYNNYFSDNSKAIISGSVAGAFGFCSTLPLDYIKQHMQNNKSLTSIIKNTKVRSYFNGGFIGLTTITPQMAIKYFCFHNFNKILDNKQISAFSAGLIDGAFLGPILAIQSFKQMEINNIHPQASMTPLGHPLAWMNIIKKNYISLMIPMALRNGIYTCSVLGGYFYIKDNYLKKDTNFIHNFLIASVLNIPGTILSSPFDVIRARHTYNLVNNNNMSLVNLTKSIYKNGKLKAFYKGYPSLFINFALRFPLTFALQFEILKLL